MNRSTLFLVWFGLAFLCLGLINPGYLHAEGPVKLVKWKLYKKDAAFHNGGFREKLADSLPLLRNGFLDAEGNVWVCTISGQTFKITNDGAFEPNGEQVEPGVNLGAYYEDRDIKPEYLATKMVVDHQNIPYTNNGNNIWKFEENKWQLITPGKEVFPYRNIAKMKFDIHGNLWVKGFKKKPHHRYKGLSKYDGANWTHFFGEGIDVPQQHIFDFDLDENGHVWVSSYKAGIVKFDGETWHTFAEANAQRPKFNLYSICRDRFNKIVWAGGNSTFLARFDEKKYELSDLALEKNKQTAARNKEILKEYEKNLKKIPKFLRKIKKMKDKPRTIPNEVFNVTAIGVDGSNSRWVGTDGSGLIHVTGNYTIYIDQGNSALTGNFIRDIQVNALGHKLITCKETNKSIGAGLAVLDDTFTDKFPEWKVFHKINSPLFNIKLQDFVFDDKGTLWGASTGAGLFKFNPAKQSETRLFSSKNLFGDQSSRVIIMPNGDIFVGSYGQHFKKFNGSGFDSYKKQTKKFLAKDVNDMILDKKGNLWVVTGKGLAKYDGTAWTLFNKKNKGLPAKKFYAVMIDADDNIWMGTKQGLIKYDLSMFTPYTDKNSQLPSNKVYALAQDKTGIIWAGTSKGLVSFDGSQWTAYDQFKDKKVLKLKADSKGHMWVALKGGSLFRFDGQTWLQFTHENSPIIFNEINDMVEYDGGLWLSVSSSGFRAILPVHGRDGNRRDAPKLTLRQKFHGTGVSHALIRYQL